MYLCNPIDFPLRKDNLRQMMNLDYLITCNYPYPLNHPASKVISSEGFHICELVFILTCRNICKLRAREKYFMKKNGFTLALILSAFSLCQGQIAVNPNSALKSHETLSIIRVEGGPEYTKIYLQVENLRQGGNFCADKNIVIIYPDGTRLRLIKADGIPVCPEIYKFSTIGEKLSFTLTFPPLRNETGWFDLVEDCQENCFWFYGVTINNDLNKRIDELFALAARNTPEQNIRAFRSMLEELDNSNPGIEGLLYINIINAAIEAGDRVEASVWYNRLKSSDAPRREQYLKYLNDKGIRF